MNNYELLKLEAKGMMPTVVRVATAQDSDSASERRRYAIACAIRAELDSHKLQGAARRFCADYLMAQFGYGGGF